MDRSPDGKKDSQQAQPQGVVAGSSEHVPASRRSTSRSDGTIRDTDELVRAELDDLALSVETLVDADVLAFMGPLTFGVDRALRDIVEERDGKRMDRLAVILETEGGYIEVVQRIADTLRRHYAHVAYIVPDHAMSAGTVLVMSGDEIWMDYCSVLGPIDPQVGLSTGGYVPAVGYLEQFERLVKKADRGTLTTAELVFLLDKFDPAELYLFEQARELSKALLKEWLVKYKFKNWTRTESRGKVVTQAMRTKRALDVAQRLDNASHWHSHGRGIAMEVLRDDLRLRIEDFGANRSLGCAVRAYHRVLGDYSSRVDHEAVLHCRGQYLPIDVAIHQ